MYQFLHRILSWTRRNFSMLTGTQSPVTIILTTFNQPARQIEFCVQSILNQTFREFTLLIIDDGSSNLETINYLNEISQNLDLRITIDFQINRGVIGARNYGIRNSRSRYLVFIDPDDSINSTFLEKCYLVAESYRSSNLAIVHTDVQTLGDRGNIWETSEMLYKKLLSYNTIPVCNLIRRAPLLKVGGFSQYMDIGYEDWECWVKISKFGYRSIRIPEPLFNYKFSETLGRDSSSRAQHDKIHERIKFYNPRPLHRIRTIHRKPLTIETLNSFFEFKTTDLRPVFIFVPWLLRDGGAENLLRTLAKGLVANGRTVVFVSTKNEISSGLRDFLDISPYIFDLSKFLMESDYLPFVNNLLNRANDPIVINCGSTWLYDNLSLLEKHKNGNMKSYDILFNEIGHLDNFISKQDLFNHVIPVHRKLESLILAKLNNDSRVKVTRIAAGIEPVRLQSKKPTQDKIQIGWIGRLSEEKRPHLFINSARNSKVKADFNLAGTGPLFNWMLELSSNLSNVKILGRVENNYEFLNSIDLLINTSSIEGIPLTALEAISLGVPVIAPDIGGMSELIIDGKNGYLYDKFDFESLVLKIQDTCNTPGKLIQMQKFTKEMGLPKEFLAETMNASFKSILD